MGSNRHDTRASMRRVHRAAAYDEITDIGAAILDLARDDTTWSPLRAAGLYDERARAWTGLLPLVDPDEPAIRAAVCHAASADRVTAYRLRAYVAASYDSDSHDGDFLGGAA